MIERAASMAFAAGALVFPGGRIDAGDHALAAKFGLDAMDAEDAAARIAAIRETIEEVGVAVGLDPLPDARAVAGIRAGLAEGGDFATLLAAARCRLDLERLTPFARWCPNMPERRNFDTRFYLAAAPEGAEAVADGGESVHLIWADAEAVLADADAGHHRIIFPTRRNLERLARLPSYAEACDHAAGYPVMTITPWIEDREDGRWLCIPQGCGYPVTAEPLISALRG
jgi:8-oxo-dGTP pyrophosphatase MutT (NUDIX family)